MTLTLKHDTLILDAACTINLYALGKMAEILRALPAEITIAAYVAEKESLRIRGPEEKQPIDLAPLIEEGLITIVALENDGEKEIAISIAAAVGGQGEADTGAIAIHRDWAMATDDRRARNHLSAQHKSMQRIYTLELVKQWADNNCIADDELRQNLQNILEFGRYRPRKANPLHGWWEQNIE